MLAETIRSVLRRPQFTIRKYRG